MSHLITYRIACEDCGDDLGRWEPEIEGELAAACCGGILCAACFEVGHEPSGERVACRRQAPAPAAVPTHTPMDVIF